MLEVVARLDALGSAERGIVKVGPGIDGGAVFHRDRRSGADVKTSFGIRRAVTLQLIERAKSGDRLVQLVDLPHYLTIRGRHGGRIDAEIEEQRANGAAPPVRQVLIKA